MEANSAPGMRIGDAERDQAVSALGDHFAAGRLTREELDERIDQAIAARYADDLAGLFVDLPKPVPAPVRPAPVRPAVSPVLALLPVVLVVAVVTTALVAGAPWLLSSLLWIFLFSGLGRHHRPHRGPGH